MSVCAAATCSGRNGRRRRCAGLARSGGKCCSCATCDCVSVGAAATCSGRAGRRRRCAGLARGGRK